MESHKNKLQPNTYETYLGNINNHIYPYFRDKSLYLKEIKSEDIEAYYDFEISKGLSSNTVIRIHANIHTAFRFAMKKSLIQANPMEHVSRPKASRFMANYYNSEQLEDLFYVSKDSDIYIVILLAAYLGLRRSEIIGLRWDSINFKQGIITIKRKAMRLNGTNRDVISDKLKTDASYRTLPLPPTLLCILKELKIHQKASCNKPNYYKGDAEYVCLDKLGYRLRLNSVTGKFRSIILKHDLDYIRFHDLRHSCASLLLKLNYSLKQIQEWLGHSNFVTTANIYAHIDVKDKEEMAENIDKTLCIKM